MYEYVCRSCGARQEHIHKIADAPPACEACGVEQVELEGELVPALDKQITAAGFRFRGSAGWGGIQEVPGQPGWGMRRVEGD